MMEQVSDPQSQEGSIVQVAGQYTVEAILDKKMIKKNGRLIEHYLVRWEGYPNQEDYTWEPFQHLRSVSQLVDNFNEKQRTAKRRQKDFDEKSSASRPNIKQNSKQYKKPIDKHKKDQLHQVTPDQDYYKLQRLKKNNSESSSNRIEQKKPNNYLNRQQKKKPKEKSIQKSKADSKQIVSQTSYIIPPKRINPYLTLQSSSHNHYNQQSSYKRQAQISQYGKILNHICKDGEVYYQIELVNKQGKPTRTTLIVDSKIKKECSVRIYEYLQKYLIQLELFNKLKKQ